MKIYIGGEDSRIYVCVKVLLEEGSKREGHSASEKNCLQFFSWLTVDHCQSPSDSVAASLAAAGQRSCNPLEPRSLIILLATQLYNDYYFFAVVPFHS